MQSLGELEPVRRLGFALDQATLKQIAYNNGIEKSFTDMTQAEKAQLRYIALLTQIPEVQTDMGRTITSAANAVRVLKSQFTILSREIGNIFIPMLLQIIPIVTAVVKVLNQAVKAIAKMFGFELPDLNWDSVNTGSGAMSDLADSTDDATSSAKALKRQLAGFDELNNLTTPSSGGSGSGGASGAGFELDLPEYDMLEGFQSTVVDELTDKAKELLAVITSIGAAIAAFKIAADVLKVIDWVKSLDLGKFAGVGRIPGLVLLLDDLLDFKDAIKDIMDNGPNFDNVSDLITSFLGTVGDAFLLFGNTKLGAAIKIVQYFGDLLQAIKDISENGVNFDNATDAIKATAGIVSMIGLLFGGKGKIFTGVGLTIMGLTDVIKELQKNWDAIKKRRLERSR